MFEKFAANAGDGNWPVGRRLSFVFSRFEDRGDDYHNENHDYRDDYHDA